MNVQVMTFADYAALENGKMTIVGIFDTITAKAFPAEPPPFYLAMKVRNASGPWPELHLELTDASGQVLRNEPLRPQPAQHEIQVVMRLQGVRLERPGAITAHLKAKSEFIASAEIRLLQARPA